MNKRKFTLVTSFEDEWTTRVVVEILNQVYRGYEFRAVETGAGVDVEVSHRNPEKSISEYVRKILVNRAQDYYNAVTITMGQLE